jgi:hypothetical protein
MIEITLVHDENGYKFSLHLRGRLLATSSYYDNKEMAIRMANDSIQLLNDMVLTEDEEEKLESLGFTDSLTVDDALQWLKDTYKVPTKITFTNYKWNDSHSSYCKAAHELLNKLLNVL